jgi:1-acyl-sn-glycerol-3-phosphate acyltransferase
MSAQTTLADLPAALLTMANLWQEACRTPADQLTGWSLEDRDPERTRSMLPFFDWFYHHYFRVKTDGWQHIPTTGRMLLVGSHNGGLAAPDTVMMTYDWLRRFGPERPAYGMMDPRMWRVFPPVARMATWVGCVRATPTLAIKALRQEAAVLVYPGGARDVFRPHHQRDQVCFFGQKGFIKLALREKAPIVPLISHGAHDTFWVLADYYPQLQALHRRGLPWLLGIDPGAFPIYWGLPWGLGVGPLPHIPLPVPLHTRVCPPIQFDWTGPEAARDRAYVEACYQQVCQTMQRELDQLFALYR